jgi:hypothetical protein
MAHGAERFHMGRLRYPRYGVVRTLLGGEPDVNRRTILDSWNDYCDVLVINQNMSTWTPYHEDVLRLCLDALNEDARAQDVDLQQDQGADDQGRDRGA